MLSTNKKVAIHQPNYLPWIGYFYKMYLCDLFVFLDQVELSKKAPTRRTQIKSPSIDNETQWLTIPLIQHTDYIYISGVKMAHSKNWPEQHIGKLNAMYGKEVYFEKYSPIINDCIRRATEFEFMTDFNRYLINKIANLLDIAKTPTIAEVTDEQRKDKTHLNKSIVQRLGGTTYISGLGGRKYLDEQAFNKDGIDVVYYNVDDLLGKCSNVNFKNSILEPLYMIGADAIKGLFKEARYRLVHP